MSLLAQNTDAAFAEANYSRIAIGHGEDLANAAVAFMEAINAFDKAIEEDVEDISRVMERRSDTWLWLRNAIGDFRASADLAKRRAVSEQTEST